MAKPSKLVLITMGALLLCLEIAIVWHPFNFRVVSHDTGLKNNKVAGQITGNFHLAQTVPAGLFKVSHRHGLSVHWHNASSLGRWTKPNCFSVRFANYARDNVGTVLLGWKQGETSQSWRLDAARLGNAFEDFCPKQGLDTAQAFQISIDGVDSVSGHAATVWLTRSSRTPATANGKTVGDCGLAMQLTYRRNVGPGVITKIGNGAFAFACLCSLGVGGLAIITICRRARPGSEHFLLRG